ncbi:DMT family transporter [Candidatus Cytomitobacter primus]|nr:DMT family transporter [Candidatus Cytomitobacter primus]
MLSNYIKASTWFVISILCGFFNDFILRYISVNEAIDISAFQAIFLRFISSAMILFPFFMMQKTRHIDSHKLTKHAIRSVLLFIPMVLWTYGVDNGTLIFATFMEFSIPLFVSIIAYLFLGESLKGRLLSILLGIIGISIVAIQYIEFINILVIIAMALAAILYATSDIINKHLLNDNEGITNLLFFSSVGVALISLPFAITLWKCISSYQLLLYFIQGVLGNLLVYFILKAYELTDISSLQSLRFLSFPISLFLSLKLGDKLCFKSLFIGISLLIISLSYSIYNETKSSD